MAFHSPIMRVIRDELEDYICPIPFHAPQIPVISTRHGSYPRRRTPVVDPEGLELSIQWTGDSSMAHQDSPDDAGLLMDTEPVVLEMRVFAEHETGWGHVVPRAHHG